MRKVIFTEAQLKGILGEDFDSYLPKENYAEETPENSYGTEVTLSDINSNGDESDTFVTDKIKRVPSIPFYRRISESVKKKLHEENSELVNNTYNLGKNINSDIQALAKNNQGDRLLQNMANDPNMSHGTAKKRKHDLEQMKINDPQRYANIGGDAILNAIDDKLDNDRSMSKRHKEFKKNVLGDTNAYQKAGGIKHVGNGQAHTKKNGMSVTYEN